MLGDQVIRRAAEVVEACRKAGLKLATVESCTGGLLAGAITAVAGSSDVLERGFVTYSNEAKTTMVAVPPDLIGTHGAVSAEVAEAMAIGGLAHSDAQIAVAITGVAGPGGGTAAKPVGLVHFACARADGAVELHHEIFPGDRAAVREVSVLQALDMIERAAR